MDSGRSHFHGVRSDEHRVVVLPVIGVTRQEAGTRAILETRCHPHFESGSTVRFLGKCLLDIFASDVVEGCLEAKVTIRRSALAGGPSLGVVINVT